MSAGTAGILAVIAAVVFPVLAGLLGERRPAATLTIVIVAYLSPLVLGLVRRVTARRGLDRHALYQYWTAVDPADREWPWQDLMRQGEYRIRRAWSFELDGLPIATGEMRWSGSPFGGAVSHRTGRGVFVVVRLPAPVPSMAMRMPYTFLGDDFRLEQHPMRQAFLGGEIPPWTTRGDELFTIEAEVRPVTHEAVDRAVRRALRAVHLLDLGPDTDIGRAENTP